MTSVGTDGDIYPYLFLGSELRKRGYRATLAATEHFASEARAEGLEFTPIVSASEIEQLLKQRDFWHPLRSALVVARWGARLVPRQFETLRKAAAPKNTFLVASPGVIAARLVQEHAQVPLANLVLQPWLIPSLDWPPVIMGGLTLPRWMPRIIGGLYFQLIHEFGARLMGKEFRMLRDRLGLKPVRRMFHWWFSPELVIGLFPPWFGAPQPDWPPQTRLAGFPSGNRPQTTGLSEALLKLCAPSKDVVAFTFGTGMRHAAGLFESAIEACRLLGKSAILLTTFPGQVPRDLPEFAHYCEFAPFSELFPRCAAVVHHGGIGTVAAALAAGTPQLILPFAFDQLDNALRVQRLGAGRWLKPNRCTGHHLASMLAALTMPEATTSAQAVKRHFGGRDGIECAADFIESWVAGSP